MGGFDLLTAEGALAMSTLAPRRGERAGMRGAA